MKGCPYIPGTNMGRKRWGHENIVLQADKCLGHSPVPKSISVSSSRKACPEAWYVFIRCCNITSSIHVQPTELRDFPKALSSDDGIDILEMVTSGLKNCNNLHACTWTRDGSLNSEILEALQSSQGLRELEINGRNESHYDPQLLLHFTALRKISLIMPSSSVVSLMRPWLQITGDSLRSLTIICKVVLLAPRLSHKSHRICTDVSINH